MVETTPKLQKASSRPLVGLAGPASRLISVYGNRLGILWQICATKFSPHRAFHSPNQETPLWDGVSVTEGNLDVPLLSFSYEPFPLGNPERCQKGQICGSRNGGSDA